MDILENYLLFLLFSSEDLAAAPQYQTLHNTNINTHPACQKFVEHKLSFTNANFSEACLYIQLFCLQLTSPL